MKKLTAKQKTAISNLEKAIKEIGQSGITLFGMDNDICFVTDKAVEDRIKLDSDTGKYYNEFADTFRALSLETPIDERYGTIKTDNTYKDSGGW